MIRSIPLRKMALFIKKDFLEEVSYRLSLLEQLAAILAYLITLYFIAKIASNTSAPWLRNYGGDYFAFVLGGIALARFLTIGLSCCPDKMRDAQMTGTLEALFSTPTPPSHIIILTSLWGLIFATLQLLLCFVFGIFVFKVRMPNADLPLAFSALLLTALSVNGIGMIAAAMTIVFKKPIRIALVFSYLFQVFGGVYYPAHALPPFMQTISRALPFTYSLNVLRSALNQKLPLRELAHDISILIICAAVLFPLGLFAFAYGVRREKRLRGLATF